MSLVENSFSVVSAKKSCQSKSKAVYVISSIILSFEVCLSSLYSPHDSGILFVGVEIYLLIHMLIFYQKHQRSLRLDHLGKASIDNTALARNTGHKSKWLEMLAQVKGKQTIG